MSHVARSAILRYGFPGMLAGVALCWVMGGGNPTPAIAQEAPYSQNLRPSAAEGQSGATNGTIAFTMTNPNGSSRLVIIDTQAKAFALYRIDPETAKGGGAVKLESAREYRWDLQLSEFNNLPPAPKAIKSMVESNGVH